MIYARKEYLKNRVFHNTNEKHEAKVLMARYTSNFDQERWEYHGWIY